MPKSPEEMWVAILKNLPEKTGKSLDEWIVIVKSDGPEGHKNRVQWLKEVHGIGHFQATLVVKEMEKPADWKPPTNEELLNAQYIGPKEQLRPIYEKLAAIIKKLPDASLEIRKTYVTLMRKRQFGIIQASTKTRVDLGLVLPGVEPKDRLKSSSKLGSDRITHKIVLTSIMDVDSFVETWIQQAYEADE
jgi:hypothetical protein